MTTTAASSVCETEDLLLDPIKCQIKDLLAGVGLPKVFDVFQHFFRCFVRRLVN